ncbi:hypothetical protein B0T14DRAFT_509181 [Immersiella caudata]|uniref:Uncharacterized protein n=1 Tax=Immersiella caudata TaxID=314043 RepID=A0AA39X353_9PEZI|nr:hypothetical protein B0T14DRAFT_509181 [Immersiella caudata]
MVANHGGTDLHSERRQPLTVKVSADDPETEGDATKPRVITMDGMSLSLEFEEEHRPIILQSVERGDELEEYVIAEEEGEDDICLITRLDRPRPPARPRRSSTPKPYSPEAGNDDEYDSDSTDSDEEEELKRELDERRKAYLGRLTSDQHKTVLEGLKQAGEDIFWTLSPADFKIVTGYDRSCHAFYFVNGVKRPKTTERFRTDLRKLWSFKVYPGLKLHIQRQTRKRVGRFQKLMRIRNGPPPKKPSPLRQSWLHSDLDDTKG